jgi:pimeloyl-ACP methyl ester carboxylesterase
MLESGFRVVAPDMIGFGRSDKPIHDDWHTFSKHRLILKSFIETLNLKNITLICHDWGGFFGLTIVPDLANRFVNVLVMNTLICDGTAMPDEYYTWLNYNSLHPDLNLQECFVGSGVNWNSNLHEGFNAPYPDYHYKSAFRQLPYTVPDQSTKEGASYGIDAFKFWANEWNGKSFFAVGTQDRILCDATLKLRSIFKNSGPLITLDCGHFVFEHGEFFIKRAIDYFLNIEL